MVCAKEGRKVRELNKVLNECTDLHGEVGQDAKTRFVGGRRAKAVGKKNDETCNDNSNTCVQPVA